MVVKYVLMVPEFCKSAAWLGRLLLYVVVFSVLTVMYVCNLNMAFR